MDAGLAWTIVGSAAAVVAIPAGVVIGVLQLRIIPSVPGDGIWSVVCFFLATQVRRRGLLPLLLEAACSYAAESGAAAVEAYPWPGGASYRYMGTRDLYLGAGFRDVPAGCRPVMRRPLRG
jgi:GNAT superfamily N-acetyltransferase